MCKGKKYRNWNTEHMDGDPYSFRNDAVACTYSVPKAALKSTIEGGKMSG
jgi:hypothetical protein